MTGASPSFTGSATPNGILEAVTDELLAHGEFSSGANNRSNAREAARVVIDMVRTYDVAQREEMPLDAGLHNLAFPEPQPTTAAYALPKPGAITDDVVQIACEIYSEVYVDDDKDQGDAMRAALVAALSSMSSTDREGVA